MNGIVESLLPLAVPIGKVKPDPRNARRHPERNLATIKASLEHYGQRKPIVVNKATGIIEAGNGLWQAANDLGWDKVAVAYVDDAGEVAKAYGLMDNQSALLAEWNLPVLKDLLQGLDDGETDIALTGFTADEIEALTMQTFQPKSGLIDDDTFPDAVETVCKTGVLWQLGEHHLLCGDATRKEDVDRLMNGKCVDMVFADPPFDMAETGYMSYCLKAAQGAVLIMHSDANMIRLASEFSHEFHYFLVHYYSFGFARSKAAPQQAHHLIGVFGHPKFTSIDGFKTVICEQMERDKLMPYQKRVAIPQQCISHYSTGAIYDPFGGSGSTLIACEKLGRICRMLEISPHYCDVIIGRWQQFTGKKAVKVD